VVRIEYAAFNGCTRLTSIAIPDSVTYIGDNVFNGCEDLKSITIRGTVYDVIVSDDFVYFYDKSRHHTINHPVMSFVGVYAGAMCFNGIKNGELKLSDELVVVCHEPFLLHVHAKTLNAAVRNLRRKYNSCICIK
jgi:hypothetical protein